MDLTRRNFLKIAGATAVSGMVLPTVHVHSFTGKYATIIDLTRCDGCKGEPIPLCVKACKEENKAKFPEPVKNIQPYWPHKFYEDWSTKRDVFNTLTPYNWIFVQRVVFDDGREIFIPRRCMHCDNPPCVSLCPFGALAKEKEGNTVISDKLCFGGAKCRDVCPWHIPQRQAGVGLYLKIMPKFAGGGVMYKCDLCSDRIINGKQPACVEACQKRLKENTALAFGERNTIFSSVAARTKKEGLHIYGDTQNGGTSTLYLSQVPFALIEDRMRLKKEKFQMATNILSPLEKAHGLAKYFVVGSVIPALAAVVAALCAGKKKAKPVKDTTDEDT